MEGSSSSSEGLWRPDSPGVLEEVRKLIGFEFDEDGQVGGLLSDFLIRLNVHPEAFENAMTKIYRGQILSRALGKMDETATASAAFTTMFCLGVLAERRRAEKERADAEASSGA